jgi:ferric-dicitrate binding protein FerR (iron transport regulator)
MTTEWRPDPVAEAVATLIHAAGRREDPPAEAYHAVLAAAAETLRRKVGRRRRWRIVAGLAAAVAVMATAAAVLRTLLPEAAPVQVARVDRLVGGADVRAPGSDSWVRVLDAGGTLRAGTRVRTREDGVAGLVLADGVSLRLASVTEVELDDDTRVHLRHGTLYADTGPGDGGTISVVTPAGTAHDFGTQFEVGYLHERLRLRVREGRVALLRDAERVVADAGTQLDVDAAGEVSRTAIARGDAAWQWAEAVAPVPDFDDQPVTALLEWVARETGRRLHYASADVERQASATILHGKVGQLAPLDALEAMLATTDLACELRDDGTIEVRHR